MSVAFKNTNGKFKARLPGDTSNKRIDDIGNYERKEKAAVRDFKAHPWNGNEASQADYVVQQWKLFNGLVMLTKKSATGRTKSVSAVDMLTQEEVSSSFTAVGAEPLPYDSHPTQAQLI